jgi:hypothetical protein
MPNLSDDLPVLVIDGAHFSDFDGFIREFSRLLCNYETPENGWVLRWLNSELSRTALGYEATTRRVERLLLACHPSNRSTIEARISCARSGQGPTLFDEIVDIIRDHGPGGNESEDGVVLQLF